MARDMAEVVAGPGKIASLGLRPTSQKEKAPREAGPVRTVNEQKLVVADAEVVAPPPIRAASDFGPI